jgi:gamma-glutamyltranspeptidase/glutathione hydrolase
VRPESLRSLCRRSLAALSLILLAGCALVATARELPGSPPGAAVASAHPLATAAGREVLDAGGNAFDAAIAVAAALAVVEPYSSGIGGGGFFLLHRASDGFQTMVDAREFAPGAASADMYLDAQGTVVPGRSMNGALAAAIPGLPAGLVHLAAGYGALPLSVSLAPAVKLARDGFEVTEHYQRMAGFRAGAMRENPETARIFLLDGEAPPLGHRIRQPDLAATLARLGAHGSAGFYAGGLAERLVAGVRAGGGLWTLEDLARYRVVEREPVTGSYRGIRIVSAPPPSSGGTVLIEALNILEGFELAPLDPVGRAHLTIEAMRRAYRDRAEYLGDPDFTPVPVAQLTSKDHARAIAADLSPVRATPSSALKPIAPPPQGDDTTHFSLIDAAGNRVAATLSVNFPFGCAFTPPGTGVLLNNEMDDFSSKALTPNGYGLVGVEANAIAPYKRPLSSMTPTFLETPERIGILGTPGGSRIISMVLLGALSFADGAAPAEWVATPRYHHQYLPDEVLYEPKAFDDAARAALAARGHSLRLSNRDYGNMHAVLWTRTDGTLSAASDPRGEGEALVWQPASAPAARGTGQ